MAVTLFDKLFRRFSRWTQSDIPLLDRLSVEWGPEFTFTDDPLGERLLVNIGGYTFMQQVAWSLQAPISAASVPSRPFILKRNWSGTDQLGNALVIYARGTLTASDTDYWTLKVSAGDAFGTVTSSALQSLKSKITGSGATGSWAPASPSTRRFITAGSTIAVPAGGTLLLEVAVTGTPGDLPPLDIAAF